MKTSTIDTISGISPEEFKKQYLVPQKPVVIKGLADNYPAGTKWTIDYIKELCGSVMVDVFDNNNSNKGSAFTTPAVSYTHLDVYKRQLMLFLKAQRGAEQYCIFFHR